VVLTVKQTVHFTLDRMAGRDGAASTRSLLVHAHLLHPLRPVMLGASPASCMSKDVEEDIGGNVDIGRFFSGWSMFTWKLLSSELAGLLAPIVPKVGT
jgi:hypothetical protein